MKIALFLTIFLFSFQVRSETEMYFTPSADCENHVVEAIDNSEKQILIAMYSFNNTPITDALKRAYERGVEIHLLADKVQASQKTSSVPKLYQQGLDVRVHTKYTTMHTKMAIFDGKVATTGSFNWTNKASCKNYEVCLFHKDETEIIDKMTSRFWQMWQENTQEKSDKWFHKKGFYTPLRM